MLADFLVRFGKLLLENAGAFVALAEALEGGASEADLVARLKEAQIKATFDAVEADIGTTTALESMVGLAMAMLGRSRPQEPPDKGHLIRSVAGASLALVVFGLMHAACAPPLNPQPLPPRAFVAAVVR